MENFLINSSYLPLNEELSKYKNIYAIVDSNVFSLYSSFIKETFGEVFVLECCEEKKNLESVSSIISWLLEKNADRNALLVGVGGGITTDICGFIASIYKRGIRFGLVPTTLTAQVDAAIGGKTGVNFGGVKNVAGSFAIASFIYINPTFLKTLPEREIRCGWGELLKTFVIGDRESFLAARELLQKNPDIENCFKQESQQSTLEQLLTKAILIKSDIVEKDRYELGIRALLNLGHTYGHAIESCCALFAPNKNICNHGEAVGTGIGIAAQFSVGMGLLPQSEYELIADTLAKAGYPTLAEIIERCGVSSAKDFARNLIHFIGNDKKCKEDFINFVFIIGVGKVTVLPTPLMEIEKFTDDLCND